MDNKSVTESVVRKVVAGECAAIEARRRMSEKPSSAMSRMQALLQQLRNGMLVNPDGGPYGDFLKRAGGGFTGFMKRMGRHFVSWYLDPVYHRQTNFNRAATVSLEKLVEHIGELEAANAKLAARNEQLAHELSECQIEMARRLSGIEETLAGKHGER